MLHSFTKKKHRHQAALQFVFSLQTVNRHSKYSSQCSWALSSKQHWLYNLAKHTVKRSFSIPEQSVKCIDDNITCLLQQQQTQRDVCPVLPRSQRTLGAKHMAYGGFCSESMAYDEPGTSGRSAAVAPSKTMKQHNQRSLLPRGATQRPELEAHFQPGM